MPATTFATDRELKALKPSDKHYDAKDERARNLIVRVSPESAKGGFRRTFCLVIRFPGSNNPARHSFGEYKVNGRGDLTLEEAREKAAEWRALIRKGIDPRDDGRREKAEARRQRDTTFGAVIEDYLARHVKGQRKAGQVEREIRSELIPVWKDRPIAEITRSDVVDLIEAIADRPAPYQAHNVFGHCRTFFGWAIDRSKYGLEHSPCDRLRPGRIIGERKPRQRVLTDEEIAAFWRASKRLGYPYGPLFQMLLLTGQRRSEVAEARWREFHPNLVRTLRERRPGQAIEWSKVDNALKTWTIPALRFKSDSEHSVPLSDEALAVLEQVPHFGSRAGDHVFSTTFGELPVNGFSKRKAKLDALMLRSLRAMARLRGANPDGVQIEDWVLHDIRRSVRTQLSSLRVPERVAEMCIGHGAKGLIRVYDQHQFSDEMREAFSLWAARLRTLTEPAPANVVVLKSATN